MTTPPNPRETLRALVGPLAADLDTMRDVYMTRVQREAFDRIAALAAQPPAVSVDEVMVEVGQIDEVQPFMGSGVAHYFFRKDRLPKGTKVYVQPAALNPTQDAAHGGRG